MSADATLSVALKAELTELSRNLKSGKNEISAFAVAAGGELGKVEDRFKSLGLTAEGLAKKLAETAAAAGGFAANSSEVGKYTQQIKESRSEVEKWKATLAEAKANNQQLKNEITQLKAEQQRLNNEFKEGKISEQSYRTELARVRSETARYVLENKTARQSVQAAAGSYDEARMKLSALGKEIRAAGGAIDGTNPKVKSMISEYNRLNDALKKVDSQMGNHQRNVGNYRSALSGWKSDLAGMAAGYASIQGLMQLSGAAFDSALKTDAIATSLQFTFKNAETADQKLNMLRETAGRLGLEYVSLADAYRSFTGAAIASNYPVAEADKIFLSVANAAAKLKLSSDQTQGALTALQQMISKGTVQSEELRGQLGERLPGAFSIAARAMGVTTMELGKMLQGGEVLAVDLLPKLADELDKTFGDSTTGRVDSLQSSVNRLKNTFSTAVQDGNIATFFKIMIDGLDETLGRFGKLVNSTSWKEFSYRLGALNVSNPVAAAMSQQLGNAANIAQAYSAKSDREKLTERFRVMTRPEQLQVIQSQSLARDFAYDRYQQTKNPLDRKYLEDQVNNLKELNSIYKEQWKTVASTNKEISDSDLSSIASIQKRITELKKLDGSAEAGNPIYNRIQTLQQRLKELRPDYVDNVTKAFNELKTTLKQIDADTSSSFEDLAKKRAEAYRKAVNDLIKNGLDINSATVKTFQDKIQQLTHNIDLKPVTLIGNQDNLNNLVKSIDRVNDRSTAFRQTFADGFISEYSMTSDEKKLTRLNTRIKEITDRFVNNIITKDQFQIEITPVLDEKKALEKWANLSVSISGTVNEMLSGVTSGFAEMLGALASDTGSSTDKWAMILAPIADAMISLGKLAIGTGIAVLGIKKALDSLNPAVAIAAGVALVALGSAVKSSLSNIASTGSSGSSDNHSGTSFTIGKHAEGGLFDRPTIGIIGEYANAATNPEVVAPLNKLQGYLKSSISDVLSPIMERISQPAFQPSVISSRSISSSVGKITFPTYLPEIRIQGRDLVTILRRQQSWDKNR